MFRLTYLENGEQASKDFRTYADLLIFTSTEAIDETNIISVTNTKQITDSDCCECCSDSDDNKESESKDAPDSKFTELQPLIEELLAKLGEIVNVALKDKEDTEADSINNETNLIIYAVNNIISKATKSEH